MDCMDCHNRPSHRFDSSPERAVTEAMAHGEIPQDLPFIRREAVAALKATYPSQETPRRRSRTASQTFYRTQFPESRRTGRRPSSGRGDRPSRASTSATSSPT